MRHLALVTLLAATMLGGCFAGEPSFSTGQSTRPNAGAAAREATRRAIAGLQGKPLQGVVFTVFYPRDPSSSVAGALPDRAAEEAAARAVANVVGVIPNVGLRARGMTQAGTALRGGVSVLAIGGSGVECRAISTPIFRNRHRTGKRLASELTRLDGVQLAICLSEMSLNFETGDDIDPDAFLKGLFQNLPASTVVWGGNAMNDPSLSPSRGLAGRQFFRGAPVNGRVVAMGVSGAMTMVSSVSHEFRSAGPPVHVTGVQGEWVTTLNKKPALSVYLRAIGEQSPGVLSSDWGHGVAVCLRGRGKRQHVQMMEDWIDADQCDRQGRPQDLPAGAIRFSQPIPLRTVVQPIVGGDSATAILRSANQAIVSGTDQIRRQGKTPALVLLANCCTRGMRLRELTTSGADPIRQGILPTQRRGQPLPVFGFYTFGGIGPIGGTYKHTDHQFQQHTLITTVVGVKKQSSLFTTIMASIRFW